MRFRLPRNPYRMIDHLLAGQAEQTAILNQIHQQGVKLMSQLDDAVAALSADISTLSTDLSAGIAALQAAIAAGNPTDIAAQVANLSALDSEVKAMDATAKSLVPPAAPAPGA